ncbi:MAG: apolipoprotein N-acyltransferase [Myxococcales bacterium]|nr:apolipoprotein N-acyltransferase [Myxococcales bacterium]
MTRKLLMAALSGLLAASSYPLFLMAGPNGETDWFSIPWLIFIAFVPLHIASFSEPSGRRRFALGVVAGAVHLACMQHWIADTLVLMSHFPRWLALIAMLVYSTWIGVGFGLVTWASGRVRDGLRQTRGSARARGFATFLLIPAAMVVLERYFPALFPFHAAGAFFEHPLMMQTAAWFGITGVSVFVHAVSTGLAHTWLVWRDSGRWPWHVPLALLGVWAVVMGASAWRLGSQAPVSETMSVLLIQPNVTVEQKNAKNPAVREGVWADTVRQTRAAAKEVSATGPIDFVVWPEGGFPFTYENPEDAVPGGVKTRPARYSEALRRFVRELDFDFLTGSLATLIHQGERRTTNSALLFPRGGIDTSGQPVPNGLRYNKQMLLFFGESVPFAETFPKLREAIPGMSHYVPGEAHATWTSRGVPFAFTLCYEAIFGDFTASAVAASGARYILNITNDVWFGVTTAPAQHLMVQVPRSVELDRALVRSTNSGITAFVDRDGTIAQRTNLSEATSLHRHVDVSPRDSTLYALAPEAFLWLCVVVGLMGALVPARRDDAPVT